MKGFLLSSLSSLILLSMALTVPGAGSLLIVVCPQPVLRRSLHSGPAAGAALVAATTLASGLLFGWFGGLAYLLFFGVLPLCQAMLLQRGCKTDVALLVPTTIYAVTGWTVLLLSTPGTEALSEFQAEITRSLEASLQIQEQIFPGSTVLQGFRERLPHIVSQLMGVLPALSFISLGCVGLANMLILRSKWSGEVSNKARADDLKEWQAPELLVWLLIATGYVLLIPKSLIPGATFKLAALNVLIVLFVLYFFQGLAIVAYFFHKKKVPLVFQLLGYGLIVVEQFVGLTVAGIGLFDLWGDFRRLRRQELGPQTEANE